MSGSFGGSTYFIRLGGRMLGPFDLEQLKSLRDRGKFSPTHEYSTDRQNWQSAASLTTVFPSATKRPAKPDRTEVSTPENPTEIWFYSSGKEQIGPVSLKKLERIVGSGRLARRDLVWKEGMPEWKKIADVPELNDILESMATTEYVDSDVELAVEEVSDDAAESHFLDHFLPFLRSIRKGSARNAANSRRMIEIGRYSIYLSIVLTLLYTIFISFRDKKYKLAVIYAILYAIAALAMQHSAIKICESLRSKIAGTTHRMSSTVFFDSLGMMYLASGVMGMILGIYASSTLGFWTCGVGLAWLIGCVDQGLSMLHSESFGIRVSRDASPGEESIAIVSVFLKLLLLPVPTFFALGTAFSNLGTAYAIYAVFARTHTLETVNLVVSSASMTLSFCAMPFVMYVCFVFSHLVVDVLQSILILPTKLDQLTEQESPK